MLQFQNDMITETVQSSALSSNLNMLQGSLLGDGLTGGQLGSNYYDGTTTAWPLANTVYWNNYPVYICTDKTAKAIQILKCLQAEKTIEVRSVPKFIELVEKIAAIL